MKKLLQTISTQNDQYFNKSRVKSANVQNQRKTNKAHTSTLREVSYDYTQKDTIP